LKDAIIQTLGHGALLFWPERQDDGNYLRPVN